ncbi:hypothetical protein FP435_00015 (plasmid) [Lactobacillus sp. PV037]|uniref:hypothetical protein n=1 Tax=Lactobacillus sp. PV037 TaxID=2594496 RepID=UPI00223F7A2E|nr:hypothetical protein [Lactobacillus sp. PV037]QNQ82925.1 hypothetical protein FP435_00015 [Lactobacillus sp. PV037]
MMQLKKLIIESPLPYKEEQKALHIANLDEPAFILANHSYVNHLKEKEANFNFLGGSDNTDELLLLNKNLADSKALERLVTSYTLYQKQARLTPKNYTSVQLQSFLKLIHVYSVQEDCEALETLKKFFTASLAHTLPKELNNIKEDGDKNLKILINYFSVNIEMTNSIIDFLWKIHQVKVLKSDSKEVSTSPIIILDSDIYSTKAYYQLIVNYLILSGIKTFIDSEINLKPLKKLLTYSTATVSIARFEDENPHILNYLLSITESLWVSTHLKNQNILFSFIANRNPSAIGKYSLSSINNLLNQAPYNQFVGMYLTLNEDNLQLIQFKDEKNWKFNTFDPDFLSSKLLPQSPSNSESMDKIFKTLVEVKDKIYSLKEEKSEEEDKDIEKKLDTLEESIKELSSQISEQNTSVQSNSATAPFQINKLFEETIARQLENHEDSQNFDD